MEIADSRRGVYEKGIGINVAGSVPAAGDVGVADGDRSVSTNMNLVWGRRRPIVPQDGIDYGIDDI